MLLQDVLYIDLSKKQYHVEKRADLFQECLGGAGVAIRLLNEECPTGCDPLGPDNPIIFAVGPLTGLFPMASKTVAMFKSPHTGNLGESHCGGRSATSIRLAGYGAIVIKGAGEIPLYLSIQNDKVYFRDATSIWGINNSFTVGRIVRENEPGAGIRTIMRIGGAGEKLVSYACVTTETYRHFGRLGLGAVFGSKKLKAVVVTGGRSFPVPEIQEYRKLYDDIFQTTVNSAVTKKYHDLGTAENIIPLNVLGGLPVKNLTESKSERAPRISGEAFAEGYLGKRLACSHCPVGCVHIAALREPYPDEAYYYKTHMISYDYEPIYAVGSLLGIFSPQGILRLMEQIEMLGLDVMTTGVILAWATEAQEKRLISEKETLGLRLNWSDWEIYMQAVQHIVDQPNEFYQALAKGVSFASSKYGGKEFALSFGGNEMPGYHTGPGTHAGVLMGSRHSHLDNAGYSFDQKNLSKGVPPEKLADQLVTEECWRQVLTSLVICLFARGIYTPEIVSRTLEIAGYQLTESELNAIGHRIYLEKQNFKIREGFDPKNLTIPERILETPAAGAKVDPAYIRQTISCIVNSFTALKNAGEPG